MTPNPLTRSLAAIAAFIIAVVVAGIVATRLFEHSSFLSLMLVLVALVAFFGLLMSPGATNEDGTVREARIRLAIAATLVIVYVVFFGTTVFFRDPKATSGFAEKMLETLTTMLTVVLPFYFGASAVAEYGKRGGESEPSRRGA